MTLTQVVDGRQCHTCDQWKPLNRFQSYASGTRKTCMDCRNKTRRASHVSGSVDPLKARRSKDINLRREYGISADEYDAMAEAQHHVCKMCGLPETRTRNGAVVGLVVDHDHDTGRVRGLLCSNCNVGIGYLKHDVALLHKAIAYLTEKEGEYHRTI